MTFRAKGSGQRAKVWLKGTICLVGALLLAAAMPHAQAKNPFLGQWNITGQGADSAIVYWLELKEEGGKLTSLFLNRTSHPIPLTAVRIVGDELIFRVSGTEAAPTGPEYHAKVINGKLVGSHTTVPPAPRAGAPAPATPFTPRTINWVGVRPPVFPAGNANGKHEYGAPIVLYDESMKDKDPATLFDVQNTRNPINWSIQDGLLTNKVPGGNNLISKQKFNDFKALIEYKLEPKTEKTVVANSGLYLRGRYEIQILDDVNDTTTEKYLTQAAVYGRTAPSKLASKPAGEWQSMEAIIVGNHVTVTLNGQRVQDNTVIGGVTGGALDNDELAPGPVMVQGDHGQIWVRKLVVTPITKAGK